VTPVLSTTLERRPVVRNRVADPREGTFSKLLKKVPFDATFTFPCTGVE